MCSSDEKEWDDNIFYIVEDFFRNPSYFSKFQTEKILMNTISTFKFIHEKLLKKDVFNRQTAVIVFYTFSSILYTRTNRKDDFKKNLEKYKIKQNFRDFLLEECILSEEFAKHFSTMNNFAKDIFLAWLKVFYRIYDNGEIYNCTNYNLLLRLIIQINSIVHIIDDNNLFLRIELTRLIYVFDSELINSNLMVIQDIEDF